MVRCRVEAGDFLASLQPGMRRIELTLRRGERMRAEGQAEYWVWQGLRRHDAREFQLTEEPQNLLRAECRGFTEVNAFTIRHKDNEHRRHTLVFKVEDQHALFHWTQPGVFLESFERNAGQHVKPRAHRLGEVFSASINSLRWLRVWIAGQSNWEVSVAGRSWQRAIPGDGREFVELSLASLALSFPQGGEVSLRVGASERLVARFSSPLQPVQVTRVEGDAHKGFRFDFSEPVIWARPVAWDVATGKRWSPEGQRVDIADCCAFAALNLPPIECASVTDEALTAATHPLTLQVPKRGWPEGMWVIELETRRDEQSEWERVVLRGREHAPVTVSERPRDLHPLAAADTETDVDHSAADSIRARLFWNACAEGEGLNAFTALDEEGRGDLFELLSELIELRQRGLVPDAWQELGWLKKAVRALSQLAGRVARQSAGGGLQIELLNLACQDASHAGFIYLPGLLALPGRDYQELPTGDALNDALRWCGGVVCADSVAELARHDFALFDMSFLGCFANFMQVAATPEGEPAIEEFQRFNHQQYWLQVLGQLHVDHLAADWSGASVLGKAHLVWALDEFVRRYETSAHKLHLGAANALLHAASGFRAWLYARLAAKGVMSAEAWQAPWPRFESPEVDFLESAPRFASLFALAARAAAAGWLELDEALKWIEARVPHLWMAEEGIAVLVRLAPELFGHQLLFWEVIIRTAPHEGET
jgi:hypothetical protein